LQNYCALFSFVGGDGNNNFDPDDSVRKETENTIDSGSQDVQVESDSEPDHDQLSYTHSISNKGQKAL
jgi:hypothetical protein